MIDYRELDEKVMEYLSQMNGGSINSQWLMNSTSLEYPKTMARLGAEWYKSKLMDEKHNFKVKMEYFPTGMNKYLEKMSKYIEDTYNDITIKIRDMKVVFEKNNFQDDGIYRVVFVYQELT